MSQEIDYGVCSPEQIAGLSGLELLQAMIRGDLPAPPMAQTLGFRLVEIALGHAVFEGRPGPQLLNPLGSVHSGWGLTLIDSAAGCALHSELGPGIGYTTVETKVNFTRPIKPDGRIVRAEGKVVSRGRQIGTAEARIIDDQGKLLAHGTSTLIIFPAR